MGVVGVVVVVVLDVLFFGDDNDDDDGGASAAAAGDWAVVEVLFLLLRNIGVWASLVPLSTHKNTLRRQRRKKTDLEPGWCMELTAQALTVTEIGSRCRRMEAGGKKSLVWFMEARSSLRK